MTSKFRDYMFPVDHPRLAGLHPHDPISYTDSLWELPVVGDALAHWTQLFETTTFRGITADGNVIPGLFESSREEGAPTATAVKAAQALLDHLPQTAVDQLVHPIGSKVWRAWMNPEFYLNRYGLRIEELDADARELVLALLRASLSDQGFTQAQDVMRCNAFLGDIVGLPRLLNEDSYNINIFGTPSSSQPWGWNLYGHHLCLNSAFIGEQQALTPAFFGAEPNEIDAGQHAGTRLLTEHERAGLSFVRSLPSHMAQQAILYHHKRDPQMPSTRLHPADELHLGGAFQDNRVIPYEGLPIGECSREQRDSIIDLVDVFLAYQPDGPRLARLNQIRAHLDDTWFCWIGGTGSDDPFYYRVQSPVIMVEFDHHAGIFLANEEPEKFHIHTLVRTPNGNDYGAAWITQATGCAQTLADPE